MNQVRVLVVDDQPVLARMVRVSLERTAVYKVREETEPLSALETARDFRPDVILLDVDMPSKNGAEVALEVRRDASLRETPILFLSGLLTPKETGRRETACGPMWFLAKPATREQLVYAIDDVLGINGSARDLAQAS